MKYNFTDNHLIKFRSILLSYFNGVLIVPPTQISSPSVYLFATSIQCIILTQVISVQSIPRRRCHLFEISSLIIQFWWDSTKVRYQVLFPLFYGNNFNYFMKMWYQNWWKGSGNNELKYIFSLFVKIYLITCLVYYLVILITYYVVI